MKYTVLQPIKHDGEPLEPGDSVELSDKTAQELLESGMIAAPGDAKALSETGEDAEAPRLAADKAKADAHAKAEADKRGGKH